MVIMLELFLAQKTRNYYLANIKPANKSFQNSIGTDRYTLIEQPGDYKYWQVRSFEIQLL